MESLMPRLALVAVLLTIGVAAPRAQQVLTADQRDADMTQLASMFAKEYAPYEWKRDVIGFDLYRLTPWLQKIHQVDDLDVQEAFIEYLTSLQDTHSSIFFHSPFGATLGITVDIFDGKVLIDSINRTLLPSAQYPFGIGDELVSLDGDSVQTLIASFRKVASSRIPCFSALSGLAFERLMSPAPAHWPGAGPRRAARSAAARRGRGGPRRPRRCPAGSYGRGH